MAVVFCVVVYPVECYMKLVEEFVLWKENPSFSVKTSTSPFVLMSSSSVHVKSLLYAGWAYTSVKELCGVSGEGQVHMICFIKGRNRREIPESLYKVSRSAFPLG